MGSNQVLDVRVTNTNILFDSFWQFISNGLVSFRYFTAHVHSFLVGVMLDCGTTVDLFTILLVYEVCCHAQLWCTCMVFLPWVARKQTKGFMSSMEGVAWPIQLDILKCCAMIAQGQGLWALVYSCWVLFLLWLVHQSVTVPKVIQGSCLVSRGSASMGTCQSTIDGCLLVTVVTMLKSSPGDTQHFVESLIFLWPQIHLYNAMFVLFFIRVSARRKQVYHRLDTSLDNLRLYCC